MNVLKINPQMKRLIGKQKVDRLKKKLIQKAEPVAMFTRKNSEVSKKILLLLMEFQKFEKIVLIR